MNNKEVERLSNMKIMNRLFYLRELEKFEEKEMSIFGSQFATVEELKKHRSKEKAKTD